MAESDFVISRIRSEIDKMYNNNNNDTTLIPCIFKTTISPNQVNQCMAILGSHPELGAWNANTPILATRRSDETWETIIELPANSQIEYKWVVYSAVNGRLIEYEPGNNRQLWIDNVLKMIIDNPGGGQKVRSLSDRELASLGQIRKIDTLAGELAKHQMECESPAEQNLGHGYSGLSEIVAEKGDGGQNTAESDFLGMVKRNAGPLIKVGLVAGALFSAVVICKKYFK